LLPVQPFCPDTTAPKPQPKPDTCTNFSDFPREKQLPPVFQKDKFAFESMDHGPQHIVAWGPPLGQNKLLLHSGVIIHLPFPADRVRVDVGTAGGGLIVVTSFNSGGGMVGQATSQPISGVQTLEVTGPDITTVRVQGGNGEGVLIGVCAHPDDSGKPAPGSRSLQDKPVAVLPAVGIAGVVPGQK
jgi:hypothetical protein